MEYSQDECLSCEFESITMEFPGVKALDNISFKALGGEVLAFLGENGAGKSTLLKIFNGDYKATSGKYYLGNKLVNFKSPRDAIDKGVCIVYQERQLAPDLSVAENIFLGRLPKKGGFIDFETLNFNAKR